MSDERTTRLVQRAADGDRDAAQELLTAVLPRVRNLVRYLIRGDVEVDDIAQQCLIAVLKGLPTYRGEGTFLAWTDRITARRTFAEIAKGRKQNHDRAELRPDLAAVGAIDEYLHRREVGRMLDNLPEDQRRAVVLHHAVGMSIPEVAAFLDIPFDTAKSRVRLAMKKLRANRSVEV